MPYNPKTNNLPDLTELTQFCFLAVKDAVDTFNVNNPNGIFKDSKVVLYTDQDNLILSDNQLLINLKADEGNTRNYNINSNCFTDLGDYQLAIRFFLKTKTNNQSEKILWQAEQYLKEYLTKNYNRTDDFDENGYKDLEFIRTLQIVNGFTGNTYKTSFLSNIILGDNVDIFSNADNTAKYKTFLILFKISLITN